MLKAKGERDFARPADVDVTAIYAGIRPATDQKHYRVRHEADQNYIGLNGIRSTGLTAALGLAQHAWALHGGGAEQSAPAITGVPRLAECAPRDWQEPGHGEIICHCEGVTRREIEVALERPTPRRGFWRPAAAHPRGHGALPGVLLQCQPRRFECREAQGASGA